MPRRDHWDFSDTTKDKVLTRQDYKDAVTGDDLEPDMVFHHVLPAGHGGIDSDSLDQYGSSADNCVALNRSSHTEVHRTGTANFAANASEIPHSYNGDMAAHMEWADRNDQKWNEAFPKKENESSPNMEEIAAGVEAQPCATNRPEQAQGRSR